jgi:hypothetical protein
MNPLFHASKLHGTLNRKRYAEQIRRGERPQFTPGQPLAAETYSFSCENDLPEQVACICSFLQNVGTPERFVVMSDGSYTPASAAFLRSLHPCVEVLPYEGVVRPDLPDPVRAFAAVHPMGKKLALEMSLPLGRPAIYTDADILFFDEGRRLRELVGSPEPAWYLPDVFGVFDERMLCDPAEAAPAVNAGFMVVNARLDFTLPLERLAQIPVAELKGVSEQTAVHLAMLANGARPLPRAQYRLEIDDIYYYHDGYSGRGIVMRHYVNTIRYKFWLSVGRSLRTRPQPVNA